MEDKIKAYNEDGVLEEIEVLDFFDLEEYDHEYALYTKNEAVGDDIITYVSIITEVGDKEYKFEAITNEEELAKVKEKIDKEIELLMQ